MLYNINSERILTLRPGFADNATSSEVFEAPSWITRHALVDLPRGQLIRHESQT